MVTAIDTVEFKNHYGNGQERGARGLLPEPAPPPPDGLIFNGSRFAVVDPASEVDLGKALSRWSKTVARGNRVEISRRKFAESPSERRRSKARRARKRVSKKVGQR